MDYIEKFSINAEKKWSIIHGEQKGNPNLFHDKNEEIINELLNNNELIILEKLLDSNNDSILLECATALLYIDDEKAIQVLKILSNTKGLIGFTAKMNLNAYYKKKNIT